MENKNEKEITNRKIRFVNEIYVTINKLLR